jgi:hypothetical protein
MRYVAACGAVSTLAATFIGRQASHCFCSFENFCVVFQKVDIIYKVSECHLHVSEAFPEKSAELAISELAITLGQLLAVLHYNLHSFLCCHYFFSLLQYQYKYSMLWCHIKGTITFNGYSWLPQNYIIFLLLMPHTSSFNQPLHPLSHMTCAL